MSNPVPVRSPRKVKVPEAADPYKDFKKLIMLCNILPRPFFHGLVLDGRVSRSYMPVIQIEAPEADERSDPFPGFPNGITFALTPISWYKFLKVPTDLAKAEADERESDIINAQKIGEDICAEVNGRIVGVNSFYGLFVCNSEEGPTEEELTAADARLRQCFLQLVSQGDAIYTSSKNHSFVWEPCRIAARYLGIEREWTGLRDDKKQCPKCGEHIWKGATVCSKCGSILDGSEPSRGKHGKNKAEE